MKRDFDLIRDILLKIEELPNIEDYIITEEDLPEHDYNLVTYRKYLEQIKCIVILGARNVDTDDLTLLFEEPTKH